MGMTKKKTKLEDGRCLIYYTFDKTKRGGNAAAGGKSASTRQMQASGGRK